LLKLSISNGKRNRFKITWKKGTTGISLNLNRKKAIHSGEDRGKGVRNVGIIDLISMAILQLTLPLIRLSLRMCPKIHLALPKRIIKTLRILKQRTKVNKRSLLSLSRMAAVVSA
jgi:hypothetical protein